MYGRACLLVVVLSLLSGSATAQFNTPTPGFHDLAVSPPSAAHSWANPSATGPLRVLAISPHSALGDLVHLSEHLEMELRSIALWDRENIGYDPRFPEPDHPEASREAILERLEDALTQKKLDLILLGQCDPGILPDAVQQQIIDRVSNGVGLLMTSHGMDTPSTLSRWLETQLPVETDLAQLQGIGPLGINRDFTTAMISCYESGTGRIVSLTFHNAPTENHSLIPIPENAYAMRPEFAANAFSALAKAAQWASRQAAPFHIVKVEDISPSGPDDEEIPPGYPPEFIESVRKNAFAQTVRPYALHLDQPASETVDVWYRLRHIGAESLDAIHTTNIPLRKGATLYALDVVASVGNYQLDVWLKNRKGIVTWYTQDIYVPGWPTLSNIHVERENETATWILPNDRLEVRAEVGAGSLFSRGAEGTVFARAIDSYGRQVASQSRVVSNTGGEVTMSLDIADMVAPLLMVEVFAMPDTLIDEAALVAGAAREVFYLPVRLPQPPLQPTVVITDGSRPDHHTYEELERLRDQFGAAVYHAPLSIDALLAAGRTGLQRLIQLPPPQEQVGETAADNLRRPCLTSQTYFDGLTQAIESGILQSYAGGPPAYSLGADNAITDTEAELCLSTTCQAHFLNRLKADYGDLSALNQAWSTNFSDWEAMRPPTVETCRSRENFLPWVDFRMSMNTVFAQSLRFGANEVRRVDPLAQVGFQPLASPAKPQAGYQWDQISAAVDYMVVPNDPNALRRLQSFHPVHAWNGVVVNSTAFQTSPEQARHVAWRMALEQVPALWLDNPGTEARRASLLGPTGTVSPPVQAFGDARREIDHGLGALLLAAAPYRNSIVIVDTPEDTLLRHMLDVTDEQQEKTESWFFDALNQLGFAPTIYSMNPDIHHDLADVNTLILANTTVLTQAQKDRITTFHKEGGLIIASHRPTLIQNVGRTDTPGALTFLHPILNDQDKPELWCNRPVWIRRIEGSSTVSQHLDGLLREAGNIPMPTLKTPDGQRDEIKRYYFGYGAATIHAFLPDESVTRPLKRASLKLPDDHYAYDLRSTETIAIRNRFLWTPTPGEAAVIATLPYRVSGVSLVVSAAADPGKRLPIEVQLDTGDTTPGTHLIALRVERANGEELLYYRQLLETVEGYASTFVPLAQNERGERYEIIATDLLTGTTTSAIVALQ